jgi:3-hydroxyisobutyrate dehydrogenase-like beta-hydroxyacid dehydrogenase
VCHDVAGPQRCPQGATFADTLDQVAQNAHVVVFSLPDGTVSEQVARGILAAEGRRTSHVIDTSTIGVGASQAIATLLTEAGVGYVDAPVSGGVAGARARTLAVMYAGTDEACAHVEPVLTGWLCSLSCSNRLRRPRKGAFTQDRAGVVMRSREAARRSRRSVWPCRS